MNKRFSLVLFLFCAFGAFSLCAQEENPTPFSLQSEKNKSEFSRPKFQLGGNFGLQFGNYTAINLSPQVGIYPLRWLLLGVGGTYMYVGEMHLYRTHVFGFNAFVQPVIAKRFLLHAEYEYQFLHVVDASGHFQNQQNHNIAVGAGYRYYISDNLSIYGLVLVNLYQSYWQNDFYPFFKMGFNIDI